MEQSKAVKFKSSEIVKFKNSDGTLNGGSILDFKIQEGFPAQALIQTFDNKNVSVDVHKLIRIKHQIVGKASIKFIESVQSEINAFNKGVLSNPSNKKHQEELQLWINKYNEKVTMLDTLRSQVSALREENEVLVEKYQELCTEESNLHKEFEKFKANHKDGVDRENELSLVILSLKKAMLAGAASDYQNQLEELLNLITDLAKIK